VPVDDEHSLRFNIFFRRNRPVTEAERRLEDEIGPNHVKRRNIGNNYLQDRDEQKRETFTGMGKTFLIHDSCATESMGPVMDRTREHLGAGDITVIAVRKFILNAVKNFDPAKDPPHVIRTPAENNLRHIACVVEKIGSNKSPHEFLRELIGCGPHADGR
jgi:hypothetical protein